MTEETKDEYERGFIDGMQKQMQSSVDKAVNAMSKREGIDSGWRKRQIMTEDDDDIQDYKKPWVGLTDEERDYFTYIDAKDKARFRKYANYIETKLKEKNT